MNNFEVPELHIGVISDIIFDPHFNTLIKTYFGENIKIYPIPYGEQNDDVYRKQIGESDVIIVWLNLESSYLNACNLLYSQTAPDQQIIEEVVAACKKFYSDITGYSNVHIIWFLFEDYFINSPVVMGYPYNPLVDNINNALSDALRDNVVFIDLKHIIAEVGAANAYDLKNKYRWNAPYSKALVEAAVKEIHKQYLIEKGITKKCLVLDCDNVLWGGILSEDGIENIQLGGSGFGRPYQDFQRFVLSMFYHGVILIICSKNDLPDVMTMFHKHSEMILKEEHIACFQVNWDNKPDNIRRIAETLNISLDSMVFVDDSPIEIEAVKSMLPEVTTLLYKRDSINEGLSCFNLKSNIDIVDIKRRNETYRTNQSRETLKAQYKNYDQYITALEIKIDIHEALPIEYNRISELSQRTSKCTNGTRYTVFDIKKRCENNRIKLYSVSVSDRFSDLGLVGAFEIESDVITLFCLSCRALGRKIENEMLLFIHNNYQIIKLYFSSTGKNYDVKTSLSAAFKWKIKIIESQ
ncbi:MAG: HAD-IIIC family phosphatase [Clostridium sp.]|jgi:FkbH-like protein|nr:HAD-IIIC family phosphatase [Clostridium sp.]